MSLSWICVTKSSLSAALFAINNNSKLLSDTKVLEDVGEDLVGGDFADNVGEVVDAFTDVLAEEVAGYVSVHALEDA